MPEENQLQDLVAELACVSLILSGSESALITLSLVEESDFIGYDRGLSFIVDAARTLSIRGELITFAGIVNLLRQRKSPGPDEDKSQLDKLGGGGALLKISQSFPVQDGLVKIVSPEGEVTLADAATAASIVREKARLRGLLATLETTVLRIKNPTSEITADLAFAELSNALEVNRIGEQPLAKTGWTDYEIIVDDITKVGRGEIVGTATGIKGFDEHLGGAKGGDIIVISALDKQCKSTIALTIVNYLVRVLGIPVIIVSFEMSSILIQKRRIAMNSEKQLEFSKLMGAGRQRMTPIEQKIALDVWDTISKDPLYIIDNKFSQQEIAMDLERAVRSYGVCVLLIDYLQKFASDEAAISNFCRRMTQIPQQFNTLGVWEILVNQLNSEGRQAAAITGEPSTNYSYMSNQANRDGTVLTTLQVDLETFACACANQRDVTPVMTRTGVKKVDRPKWRYMPTSGYCPDCRQLVLSQNPVRPGKWIIEKARNAAGGRMVPFTFNGNYMAIEEQVWGGEPQQPQATTPDVETGIFLNT